MTRVQHPGRSPDIPQLLTILETHQVRYVLTGSVAAQMYGVDIGMPGDLDITPALDPDNLQRLATVLRAIDARLELDGPAGHWEIQPDGERKWIVDEITPDIIAARAAWAPNPQDIATVDHLFLTRYGNVDVVPEVSGTYEWLMERAVAMWPYGHRVWIAHMDDLLATLTVPRRIKDKPRVEQLRALQRSWSTLIEGELMERDSVGRDIIERCTHPDGFLNQLRAHQRFDHIQYQELVAKITEYHALLGISSTMERRVAGCLFALEQELENAMVRAEEQQAASTEELEMAHAEVWELVLMVFEEPTPWDTDPQ